MYYRLKDHIVLRGWDKLPYGYVDTRAHASVPVAKRDFEALKLCDGSVDVSSPLIPPEMREKLQELQANGLIEACEKGQGLHDDQRYRKYPNRYFPSAQWSITGKCNYRCRHCYMGAPHGDLGHPSFEACIDIVDSLAACGIQTVGLTGGEPLVRDDFLSIVQAIIDRGMALSQIYTNGSLVDERLLTALQAMDCHPMFCISFDGPGFHDWIRGVAGAEKAAMDAFKRCDSRGFPTTAEMSLFKANRHTLMETVRLLASWGCSCLKTEAVDDVGEWARTQEGMPISSEDLYGAYLDFIPRYYEAGLPLKQIQLSELFAVDRDDPVHYLVPAERSCNDPAHSYLCPSMRMNVYIAPDGHVLPCASFTGLGAVQDSFPSLSDKSLRECLNDPAYLEVVDSRVDAYLAQNPMCASCPHRLSCAGGCRVHALQANPGNRLAPDPQTCTVFKDGWVARVHEVADAAIRTVGLRAR